MQPTRASRTAEFMALFRAIETARPAADRLFADTLAEGFLPSDLRLVLNVARTPLVGAAIPFVMDRRWPGPRGAGVIRTRFIDDALRDALAAGAEAVVILGAGFDSRAYRIPGIERTRVFEVDHPATQASKRERLIATLGALPAHVSFVAIDFDRQRLADVLPSAALARRSFWVWEGVTNYLTAEAVDATLRYVAATASPGSSILFTYVHRGILDGSARFAGADESIATVRGVGEPFTFGFDPAALPAYLAERGLRLRDDVAMDVCAERYLRPLGRHMAVSGFYRAAIADVAARS